MSTEERNSAVIHQVAEAALHTGGVDAMIKVILPPEALEEKKDPEGEKKSRRMMEDHAIANIVGLRGGPAAAVEALMFLRGWDK